MLSLILLTICIICIYIYIYIYQIKEAFVNKIAVPNLYITPDEIFLLATNPASFKINSPSDSFDYNGTGILYKDAEAACNSVDATLADYSTITTSPSGISLLTALNLNANWCAAGWIKGDSKYAYYPMSDFSAYQCRLNNKVLADTSPTPAIGKYYQPSTKSIGVYNPGPDGKAFAICVGPKKPLPTAKVNPFNNNTYSMYTSEMMTLLKTGVDSRNPYYVDMYPIQFTDSQAYIALKENSYSTMNARKWLKDNYDTAATGSSDPINDKLNPNSEKSDQTNAWNSNTTGASCNALSDVYNVMNNSLSTLKATFHDLSGIVQNTITSKGQNGVLQTIIADICSKNPTGIVTKACGRLLSLDYDLFYRNNDIDPNNQTNYITALESINRDLFKHQSEIEQSLGSLQMILSSFTTKSGTEKCATTLSTLIGTYGNNMVPNWKTGTLQPIDGNTYFSKDSHGSTITVSDTMATGGPPSTAFHVGRDIELNGVERLKISLEEISPFFNAADYKSLISDVLNQLSLTLRTPLAAEYNSIESISKQTKKNLDAIAADMLNL